jgi:hypothetical protein
MPAALMIGHHFWRLLVAPEEVVPEIGQPLVHG